MRSYKSLVNGDKKCVLLKNVRIFSPDGLFGELRYDVLIEAGVIKSIETPHSIVPNSQTLVIESANLCASAGFLDTHAFGGAPGSEHTETFESLGIAAMAGGFTQLVLMPNTQPIVQTAMQVQYMKQYPSPLVDWLPTGALSKQLEGKQLAELLDMHEQGALAFTDGSKPIRNALLLQKGLRYVSGFGGRIIQIPEYSELAENGQMHEGDVSTSLGLKGLPALAEEAMILRDLAILRESGGQLHFAGISTAAAVALIRQAKKEGLKVTCSIPAYMLMFTHEAMRGYDTNLKVKPPLRPLADQNILIEGLKDGTIDAIASFHKPQDPESKDLEFDLAHFGMIAAQTSFSMAMAAYPRLPLEVLLAAFTHRARLAMGLKSIDIRVGELANLTVFDPSKTWEWTHKNNLSRSQNSPLLGCVLRGCVLAVFNKQTAYIA